MIDTPQGTSGRVNVRVPSAALFNGIFSLSPLQQMNIKLNSSLHDFAPRKRWHNCDVETQSSPVLNIE